MRSPRRKAEKSSRRLMCSGVRRRAHTKRMRPASRKRHPAAKNGGTELISTISRMARNVPPQRI
jgi:hypothetical protein